MLLDTVTGLKPCSTTGCTETNPNNFGSNRSTKDSLNSYCRACCNALQRAVRAEHTEEDKKRIATRQTQYRDENYEHYRDLERERTYKKYGVTKEWYEQKLIEQDNKCAICKEPETRLHAATGTLCSLSIDHDHKTLEVRGLLCSKCNRQLHSIEDSGWMQHATDYLIRTTVTLT